jgi:hypothetical protein
VYAITEAKLIQVLRFGIPELDTNLRMARFRKLENDEEAVIYFMNCGLTGPNPNNKRKTSKYIQDHLGSRKTLAELGDFVLMNERQAEAANESFDAWKESFAKMF